MAVSTMTSKGQIVVPKQIREKLDLHPGDQVDFILQSDGSVLFRTLTQDVRALKGILYNKSAKPVSLECMAKAIRQRASAKK